MKPVDQLEHRYDWLGEVLEGNDLISSGLSVRFRADVPEHTKVCSMVLDADSVAQFKYAVYSHYWYVQNPAAQARIPMPIPPCEGACHRHLTSRVSRVGSVRSGDDTT